MLSIQHLVDNVSDEFRFKIITRDRDIGDSKPYPSVMVNKWLDKGSYEILYLPSGSTLFMKIRCLLNETPHDVLYLNSVFSKQFSILILLLRRLGLISQKKAIIAPRGELTVGALNIKTFRKKAYLAILRMMKLSEGLTWHSTGLQESEDIVKTVGSKKNISVALNICTAPDILPERLDEMKLIENSKVRGQLKIVFVSRICRIKNLKFAIEMLNGLKGQVLFDIYGPLEDKDYWDECLKEIRAMNHNISVKYKGNLNPDMVIKTMSEYELFFLPTLGENFGYVIAEALAAGCPVLISDKTPWQKLKELGIGWELSLNHPDNFKKILQTCVDMNSDEYGLIVDRIRKCRVQLLDSKSAIKQNKQLLIRATS